MTAFSFPARLTRAEDGSWRIRFRDFPEGISESRAGEDVIDIAAGCLQAAIEGRLLDGIEVPDPTEPRAGEVLISVPIETAAKAALFKAVADSGLSRTELARAVDLDEKEIRRMLDPRHASKLPRIARVLKALGRELTVSMGDSQALRRTIEAREMRALYRAARPARTR